MAPPRSHTDYRHARGETNLERSLPRPRLACRALHPVAGTLHHKARSAWLVFHGREEARPHESPGWSVTRPMIQISGQFGCHLARFTSDRGFIGTAPSRSEVFAASIRRRPEGLCRHDSFPCMTVSRMYSIALVGEPNGPDSSKWGRRRSSDGATARQFALTSLLRPR